MVSLLSICFISSLLIVLDFFLKQGGKWIMIIRTTLYPLDQKQVVSPGIWIPFFLCIPAECSFHHCADHARSTSYVPAYHSARFNLRVYWDSRGWSPPLRWRLAQAIISSTTSRDAMKSSHQPRRAGYHLYCDSVIRPLHHRSSTHQPRGAGYLYCCTKHWGIRTLGLQLLIKRVQYGINHHDSLP